MRMGGCFKRSGSSVMVAVFLGSWSGFGLNVLDTSANAEPISLAPDDRGILSIQYTRELAEEAELLEKTCFIVTDGNRNY